MDVISHLTKEIGLIRQQLSEMIRLATVTEVDAETARLTCESEELVQSDIPFFTLRAGEDMTYWLPSVGELGFLISPSGMTGNAVFLAAIFFDGFPAPDTNPKVSKRIYRDEQVEVIDTDGGSYIYQNGELSRLIDTEKIEDSAGTTKRTLDKSKIEDDVGGVKSTINAQKIEQVAGANVIELSAILLNLLGAHIYATGMTGFLTGMGPVFFTKTPSPQGPPPAPAGSNPDDEGNATQIPPSDVDGVSIRGGSNITLPASITVTGTLNTPTGPIPVTGTVTPQGNLQITGNVNLRIPAKAL